MRYRPDPAVKVGKGPAPLFQMFQTLVQIVLKKELPLPIGRKATLEAPNETLYRRSGVCDASYHN
jgi:hypothetical protein